MGEDGRGVKGTLSEAIDTLPIISVGDNTWPMVQVPELHIGSVAIMPVVGNLSTVMSKLSGSLMIPSMGESDKQSALSLRVIEYSPEPQCWFHKF